MTWHAAFIPADILHAALLPYSTCAVIQVVDLERRLRLKTMEIDMARTNVSTDPIECWFVHVYTVVRYTRHCSVLSMAS